ncbi:hypothetical protein QUE93_07150 [Leuconostoc falkenbergense]|uniref:Phage protein n=1 Tax=Leuconostoc falkenbergense TaxID=2766470 RepID=A0ABT7RZQ9_9LACO|nr:hypothetical protein [Leuconostoc falkenbergense]MDM7646790.1 hypothetical protein [Leuconostoc falkenbergense]
MKFTEEQYQKIVDAWDIHIVHTSKTQSVIDELLKVGYPSMVDQALALANPLTREWAHDKFVEKEKKYYWNSIKTDLAGYHSRLFRAENDNVISYSRAELANNINEDEQLTESEIKAWGYNPEMFDREEVQ